MDWTIITGGGVGLSLVYIVLHYLKSVSGSLKELIVYIHNLQESVGELNVAMATVIAEKSNDSKRIEENREDIKELFKIIRSES